MSRTVRMAAVFVTAIAALMVGTGPATAGSAVNRTGGHLVLLSAARLGPASSSSSRAHRRRSDSRSGRCASPYADR